MNSDISAYLGMSHLNVLHIRQLSISMNEVSFPPEIRVRISMQDNNTKSYDLYVRIVISYRKNPRKR